ncbi:hypothetical protein E4U42_005226 [Claviceps africana]|uniref:HTH CENPB-type domain-containing protein n=1 Tax=Claviceps africana TaxID=83212 RepID=A0A8K0J6U6_9HYPO|nr:hypothetical protein E4U42_005226 [Claviceps africana]
MNTTADGTAPVRRNSMAVSQSDGYSHDGWTTMGPYSQSPYDGSPMNEYLSFGTFVPHGMTSESMPRMPHSPPQHPQHHQQQQHQPIMPHSAAPMMHHQLPMLTTAWPSQLTNPNPTTSSGSLSAPPLSASPVSRIPPAIDTPKLPIQVEKGRKTLTTEQKRRMCQFHEDHPGTRQADIGKEFGVERSTVSKVLSKKDQFLKREQESDSATVKRNGKSKNPDFDRTLSIHVRRQQQSGFDIKDEHIMEQARLFAHGSENQEAILATLTSSWLQKFKQKHGFSTDRLLGRHSETNMSDNSRGTDSQNVDHTTAPIEISPASPTYPLSPLSVTRSDEDARQEQSMEFGFTYRQQHSQPTASPASDVRDCAASSFSAGPLSPTGTFHFSPDPNVGGFQPVAIRQDLPHHENHHRGKRSNTFPSLDIEYANQHAPITAEPMTPQLPPNMAASSSVVGSPVNEMQPKPYAVNTGLTSPLRIRHNETAPGLAVPTSATSVETSPASPTQEDARRAANTLLNYLQNSGQPFQSSDYNALVQLTKKLEICSQQNHWASTGALSRIPEGDAETAVSPEPAMMQAR